MKYFLWRLRDVALALAVLALLALVVLRIDMAGQETVSGAARIIDGDTLVLEGQTVRLAGIDAPELGQACERDGIMWACGKDSREALRALAERGRLRCIISGKDKYERGLGVCYAGETDINAAMVSEGFALSFGRYGREEASARSGAKGVWAGTFEQPGAWRARHDGRLETVHGDTASSALFFAWLRSFVTGDAGASGAP